MKRAVLFALLLIAAFYGSIAMCQILLSPYDGLYKPPAFSAAPFDVGINFRATAGFVTDGVGEIYSLPGDSYPTTRGGFTFGWESLADMDGANRDAGVDRRFAGFVRKWNDNTPAYFRIDVPVGTYDIRLGVADVSYGFSNDAIYVNDNATELFGVSTGSAGSSQTLDAMNNLINVADWAATNAAHSAVVSSGILRVRLWFWNNNAAIISHIRVTRIL